MLIASLTAVVLLGAAACDRGMGRRADARGGAAASEPAPRVVKRFGRETWDIIEGAERVEVHRLDNTRWPGSPEAAGRDEPTLRGFPIMSSVEPPPGWARRFTAVLGDADTYLWDGGKGCDPAPGVGVRFVRGDDRVDVWLCYSCEILGIERYRGGAAEPEHSVGLDFEPGLGPLVRLAKEAFPADPQVQALPDGARL